MSNGKDLDEATMAREVRDLLSGNVVGVGRPAGLMGPKLKLRYQHYISICLLQLRNRIDSH